MVNLEKSDIEFIISLVVQYLLVRWTIKAVQNVIMAVGFIASLYILGFEKHSIEGAIAGMFLGVYIGWRLWNDNR